MVKNAITIHLQLYMNTRYIIQILVTDQFLNIILNRLNQFTQEYTMCANRKIKEKSSLEIAIENGRELIEFFKDKWDEETLKKQLYLQELSEYNLRLFENNETAS